MSLLSGLLAFWKFDEGSGPAVDCTGRGNDLTWHPGGTPFDGGATIFNSPARAGGVVGYGLDLNTSFLYRAMTTDLECNDGSFTWCGWIKLPAGTTRAILMTQASSVWSYYLYGGDAGGGLQAFTWGVTSADGDPVYGTSHSVVSGNVATNEWHFFRCGLDLDNEQIFIQIDCGTIVTATWSSSLVMKDSTPLAFLVGRDNPSFPASNATIDGWGLWNRVLDTGEASQLCEGIEWPFGICSAIFFGDYEFANTFHPADDSLEWASAAGKLPRQHGGRALDFYLQPRRLLVRGGEIKGPFDSSDLRTRVDAIRAALGAAPQNLQFESDRYWRDVRVEYFRNPYGPTHYCRIAAEMEVSFLARDPFQYAIMGSSDTWSSPTTGATNTITVGGNTSARPIFTITVGGSGPVTIDWTLENTTTGEEFTLSGSLTGGAVIVVDCLDMTVMSGSTDEISMFDGVFPSMALGDNTFQVTIDSGTITSIVTTWRSRWW